MLKLQIEFVYGACAVLSCGYGSLALAHSGDLLHNFDTIFCYIRYYYYLNSNLIWVNAI